MDEVYDYLKRAEEALRDIAGYVEHSGTNDKMIADIKSSLNWYWKFKNENRKDGLHNNKSGKTEVVSGGKVIGMQG